jgi:serine/threonine-protein kinase
MAGVSLGPIFVAALLALAIFFPDRFRMALTKALGQRRYRKSTIASPSGGSRTDFTNLVPPGADPQSFHEHAQPSREVGGRSSGDKPKDGQLASLQSRYEILQRVGTGGMAIVYRAKERKNGRTVAIKVPNHSVVEDERFVRRFHREAQVLSQINHPGIVKVYDHGELEGTHFIAMEFLDGEGLNRVLEREPLPVATAVEIVRQIAEAVDHIHQLNLTHRDIKPSNIMVLRGAMHRDGTVEPGGIRLMDFGIVGGQALTRLTVTGSRVGTPTYMSPEQIRGQEATEASDIYGLGILFYEALTGRPPFSGKPDAVFHQHLYDSPTPPSQLNPRVSPQINRIVMRMLDKEAKNRPPLSEILEVLSGKSEAIGDAGPDADDELFSAPYYLTVALDSSKGAIRIIDIFDKSPMTARIYSGLGGGKGMLPSPPLSLAIDSSRAIWVSVFEYGTDAQLLYRFSPEGILELTTGSYGEQPGQFHYPASLAALPSPKGGLVVIDSELCRAQIIGVDGEPKAHFGRRGTGKGTFQEPQVVAANSKGIYILDRRLRQVQIFDLDGAYRAHVAFRRKKEEDEFREIAGMTVDQAGNLYLYDSEAQRIRKLGPDNKLLASFAVPLEEQQSALALLLLTVDPEGGLYLAPKGGRRIHRLNQQGQPLGIIELEAPLVAMTILPGGD